MIDSGNRRDGHTPLSVTPSAEGARRAQPIWALVPAFLLTGAVAAALADPAPAHLPGIALGSVPLLLLERVGIIYGCLSVMALSLLRAWHGRTLLGRPLAGDGGRQGR